MNTAAELLVHPSASQAYVLFSLLKVFFLHEHSGSGQHGCQYAEVQSKQDGEMLLVDNTTVQGMRALSGTGDIALFLKGQVHSFGVLLDPLLQMEFQMSSGLHSNFNQFWLICQLRPIL